MAGRLSAAVTAVLLAVALAACGSASGARTSEAKVSATAYVTSLCQAVAPFESDVATRSKTLDRAGSLSASTGKRELVGFLGDLTQDSARAVTKLKSAGVPNVAGGPAFARTILTTFTRLNGTLQRSQGVAENLATSSQATFTSGATNLATAVKESVGEIGQGLSTQSNKALDAAAAKVSACHSL